MEILDFPVQVSATCYPSAFQNSNNYVQQHSIDNCNQQVLLNPSAGFVASTDFLTPLPSKKSLAWNLSNRTHFQRQGDPLSNAENCANQCVNATNNFSYMQKPQSSNVAGFQTLYSNSLTQKSSFSSERNFGNQDASLCMSKFYENGMQSSPMFSNSYSNSHRPQITKQMFFFENNSPNSHHNCQQTKVDPTHVSLIFLQQPHEKVKSSKFQNKTQKKKQKPPTVNKKKCLDCKGKAASRKRKSNNQEQFAPPQTTVSSYSSADDQGKSYSSFQKSSNHVNKTNVPQKCPSIAASMNNDKVTNNDTFFCNCFQPRNDVQTVDSLSTIKTSFSSPSVKNSDILHHESNRNEKDLHTTSEPSDLPFVRLKRITMSSELQTGQEKLNIEKHEPEPFKKRINSEVEIVIEPIKEIRKIRAIHQEKLDEETNDKSYMESTEINLETTRCVTQKALQNEMKQPSFTIERSDDVQKPFLKRTETVEIFTKKTINDFEQRDVNSYSVNKSNSTKDVGVNCMDIGQSTPPSSHHPVNYSTKGARITARSFKKPRMDLVYMANLRKLHSKKETFSEESGNS